MKFFVTGVAGQLGHDVVNELVKRDNNISYDKENNIIYLHGAKEGYKLDIILCDSNFIVKVWS